MKNTVSLLVVLIILFLDVAWSHDILSKFKQNGYKIKDKRTEVIRFNQNIFHNFEFKTFKYNRTTPAFNATFHFKVDIADQLEIVIQVYKFLSNEYRYFPIRFQLNFQKVYASNVFGFQNTKLCGNMTSFIFQKDVIHHICNFVPDDHYLPPLIPNGLFKIEIVMMYLNEDMGLFNFYGEVYIPQAY